MGGESLNVTREFARKVVTSTKLVMEKSLATTEPPTAPAASVSLPAVDRHVLTISSSDLGGGATETER